MQTRGGKKQPHEEELLVGSCRHRELFEEQFAGAYGLGYPLPMNSQDVGPALKRLRTARGWTQAELAKRAGFETRQVCAFEAESAPRLDSLGRLLEALQANLCDLHWAIVDPERELPQVDPEASALPSLLESPQAVGTALQLLRRRAGLSRQDLAKRAGVTRARASAFETGGMPLLETLEKLLRVLESSWLDFHEALLLAHFLLAWEQGDRNRAAGLRVGLLGLGWPHLDRQRETAAGEVLRQAGEKVAEVVS